MFLLSQITVTQAKKVKFAVDMTSQVLSPSGIHISCDFQVAAGFGGNDWDCGVIQLTKETLDTNIYSIVVDIPAFQKYEYKFVNGEFCYEVEFVPESVRANYNFSDNRWLYIDSLANDTTFIGAIRFNESAPAGLTMVRYRINMMQEASISPNGVHLAKSTQSWNTTANRLYSFSNSVYEWIDYVNTGSFEFKYYNGNSVSDSETVPTACATNNNRSMNVVQDSVVTLLCYSSCNLCFQASVQDININQLISISPNPMSTFTTISFKDNANEHSLVLTDMTGKKVLNTVLNQQTSYRLENRNLSSGLYILQIQNNLGQHASLKIIVE